MRKDEMGEAKHIMATLNASRLPSLKVSMADEGNKQIVPSVPLSIPSITPTRQCMMPPWPMIDMMKNFPKSNQVGRGRFHVPSS